MRVYCQCGSGSSVRRSVTLSADTAALYCSCRDPECGHSFVSEIGFKHTLELPEKVQDQLSGYAQGEGVLWLWKPCCYSENEPAFHKRC
ncbi:ogr/Delta-like zinc finger family protein [Photobacterium sp. Hal280]|uniref:ogr/Delta-like zinc finger family protein n=1 Tax=Photobacterium sp. Hal280 TaxID=3035163 RepID=UPI00301DBDDD